MDRPKFKEALLYVAWHLRDQPEGGATILNKVLYYAEFGHMRQYGHTITGAKYFKLPEGPAPKALVPVRDELIGQGEATLEDGIFNGRTQKRLVPTSEPTRSLLSDEEIRSIDDALTLLRGKTAREASLMSHEELGWRFVNEREVIPPETAFLAPQVIVTDAIRRRAMELATSST